MLMEFSLIRPDTWTRFPSSTYTCESKTQWLESLLNLGHCRQLTEEMTTSHCSVPFRGAQIEKMIVSHLLDFIFNLTDFSRVTHTLISPSWRTLSSMCVVMWVSVLEMLHVSSHWYFSAQHATSVSTLLLTHCMFVWAEQEMSSVSE